MNTTRITSNAAGREYLSTIGLWETVAGLLTESGEHLRIPSPCGRCGGRGRGPWFQDGGICYDCRGIDTTHRARTVSIKTYAQEAKARRRAAEKRAEDSRARAAAWKAEREERERAITGTGETFEERSVRREAERQAERAKSQHVGTVGQRGEFEVTLAHVHTFERPSFSGYGGYETAYIYIMTDAAGNSLVWKSSTSVEGFTAGTVAKVRATVKAHGAYKGGAQTTLTRLAVVEVLRAGASEPALDETGEVVFDRVAAAVGSF